MEVTNQFGQEEDIVDIIPVSNELHREGDLWVPREEKIKGNIGPYAEINKVPTHTPSGVLSGYAIEIENPEAPNGRSLAAPYVSKDYLLVSNQEVRQIAHEIVDESSWGFREDTVAFDGKRFTLTLVATDPSVQMRVDEFRRNGEGMLTRQQQEDTMTFGLMFRNSYDASQAFDFALFIWRLVCTNGMVSIKHLARYKFKHTRANENWKSDVLEATRVIQNAPGNLERFLQAAGTLTSTEADQSFLQTFRKGPAKGLGVTQWGRVMDRWVKHEENTAYGLLNASTNVLWHGESLTVSDIKLNDQVTSGLIDYAIEHRN